MPELVNNKRVIGLYGEMLFAMELHERGWQVYRAYIDENVDFIIARYYCNNCKTPSNLYKRESERRSFPTNLCETCREDSLDFMVRFVQVKTSEGITNKKDETITNYSFHAKLRSNVGEESFYVWIAIVNNENRREPHYYIFHHEEINRFDDLELDSYKKTDNQKTTLRINKNGEVMNKGKKHDYDCFKDFHNDFEKLLNYKNAKSSI